MKLQNPIYASDKERLEFIEKLNISVSAFHSCSSIVIRQNDIDYILKDRWQDPYISNDRNLDALSQKEFYIISKRFLVRINRHVRLSEIINVGDNVIIEIWLYCIGGNSYEWNGEC